MKADMVRLRRSNAPSDLHASDSLVGAYAGLPDDPTLSDAGTLEPGRVGAFDESGVHVAGPSFTDLLPDVQVPERDRRREQRLVEAACRGEESAIEALYRTHYDTIFRYVLLRLGSPLDRRRRHQPGVPGDGPGTRALLRRRKTLCRLALRDSPEADSLLPARAEPGARAPWASMPSSNSPPDSAGPHATAEQRELRGAVAQALAKVPEGSARSSCCATSSRCR